MHGGLEADAIHDDVTPEGGRSCGQEAVEGPGVPSPVDLRPGLTPPRVFLQPDTTGQHKVVPIPIPLT